MTGYCPDCGNTQCVCAEWEHYIRGQDRWYWKDVPNSISAVVVVLLLAIIGGVIWIL